MFAGWIIAPAVLLAATAADGATLATLSRSQMSPHEIYQFATTGRTYRAEVVEPATGQCLVSSSTDGVSFSKPRLAYVLGATRGSHAGMSLVLMGEVKVGLGVELAIEDYGQKNRFLTPDVTSISLVSRPAAADPGHAK